MTERRARDHKKRHLSKITEKADKRGEEPLKPEIDYQALIEQIPAVIYITALDGFENPRYVSPQIEILLGFSSAEWLAKVDLWVQRLHPDDRQRVLSALYSCCENRTPFRSEYRLLARDGRIVWVRDEAVVVCDEAGNPRFLQGVMFDVSDLLRAVESLHQSEEKFRTLFERAAVGIALVDIEGRLTECNPELQEMLGYRKEELLSRFFSELIYMEDEQLGLDFHKKLLSGKQDHYQVEKRYFPKEGGMVWGRENVSLVRDTGGNPQYTIHMVENINEWKQLEAQFLQSQKMETVGRLAGGIAHDFNNLLTVLKGYSQLSLLGLKDDDPLKGNITEIRDATERAAQLTSQLLVFSRRQVLDMKVLDLNTVVRGLEKMLRRIIGEDIELITHLAEDLGRVKTDPSQIEQVVLNLAVNAKDAMPRGGKLILETDNVTLDENYASTHIHPLPGCYVLLSVSDTGCGMSPEIKERIFDPFFTTKDKNKGTGLGLSTVYGIVKQSGGNIWVYSEPGQGTTFKIYLPQVEGEPDVLTQRDEAADLPRGTETILFVEDDPSVRGLGSRILRQQGYIILDAANGDEAMHVVSDRVIKSIHLLITDVVMPQMGGQELAEKFKAFYPDAKVLFISGYTDEAILHQASLSRGEPFLLKPFSILTLAQKVREVLDQRSIGSGSISA
jgi:two-component system cell cycle sensor histidine kinase/response regulator CckA